MQAITPEQFEEVAIGMAKDEVRSLLGKAARTRTIENRHSLDPEFVGGYFAQVETYYEVWDYSAGNGAYYGVLFGAERGQGRLSDLEHSFLVDALGGASSSSRVDFATYAGTSSTCV